jgi:hypothetical protein
MVSCAAVLGLSGRPHIPEHEAILLLRCQVFIIELSLGRHQVVHLMMRAARQQADKAETLICGISFGSVAVTVRSSPFCNGLVFVVQTLVTVHRLGPSWNPSGAWQRACARCR